MISMPESGIVDSSDKVDSFELPVISTDTFTFLNGTLIVINGDEELLRKISAEDYSPSAADTYPEDFPFITSDSGQALLGTTTDITAGTTGIFELQTTTDEPQFTVLEPVVPMATNDLDEDSFLSANLPFSCRSTRATTSRNTPALSSLHSSFNSSSFFLPVNSPGTPTSIVLASQAPKAASSSSQLSVASTSTVASAMHRGDFSPTRSVLISIPKDDKMAEAVLTTLETGSIMPLIKEELKYTIQSRRLAAGKPELQVEFNQPKRRKVMTEEERDRVDKRREQNRKAAQKFRQKQRDTADVLTRKSQRLDGANNTLRAEIKRLAREKKELCRLLQEHLAICPKVNAAGISKVNVDR